MRLGSGELVVDRHQSHIHPGVVPLLLDALSRIESSGRQFLVEEVDFGRPIGQTVCVRTGAEDQIVFAKRPRRFGHSRFVLNRTPEECSCVVVILKKAEDNESTYVLITAFIGHRAEPEPWDRNATEKSAVFWSSQALVFDTEPIQCWGCLGAFTPDATSKIVAQVVFCSTCTKTLDRTFQGLPIPWVPIELDGWAGKVGAPCPEGLLKNR